ncbi:restriction endonuclease subunit S [Protaetiibacter intestinalis]|uniref:Restriction endonuclease subunit S n=2 Tax=Protaetiibacter intestinalis TaxID=2419774 RepID=A0A387BC74_9MICO|nr:restriction endonuclease subunit S [Protaetiibacter intestinalis]
MFSRTARKGYPDETLLSVYRDHGVVPKASRDDNFNRASEDLSAYQLVEPGDLAVNKMKAWQGSLSISRLRGIVSPAYFVYAAHHRHEDRYLHHLLRATPLVAAYRTLSTGVRIGQWDLDPQAFSRMKLPMPPRDEQRAIADYLDCETAQIDTLIAKQEELIARLRERQYSTWARSYQRTLESAPTVALRRLVSSIVDGPFGSSLTSSHYSDTGARVIRLGNIGINEFRTDDITYIPLDYFAQLKAHEALPGDVVVAGLGDERMPLGRAAVVPDLGPAIVKADCYRLRPDTSTLSTYLAWVLSAPQTREQFALLARGSTRSRLNTSVVLEAKVPVPTLAQQREIVLTSDQQQSKIDALIGKAERFIALAKERRAALITAAVTGQLDVTAA